MHPELAKRIALFDTLARVAFVYYTEFKCESHDIIASIITCEVES